MMELELNDLEGVSVVTVDAERIVAATAIQFKDRMLELTSKGADRIVLDLTQVNFIDSSGLGAIVAAMKQLNTGQVLELACLSPTVEKVFQLTRMDTVFRIHKDLANLAGNVASSG